MPRPDEVDLKDVDINDIYGEIRRRGVDNHSAIEALGIRKIRGRSNRVTEEVSLRRLALIILGILTAVLLLYIGAMTVTSKEIPDIVSVLAGTGFGAIAGIVSGGKVGKTASENDTLSSVTDEN
jgi:hypothetical protein